MFDMGLGLSGLRFRHPGWRPRLNLPKTEMVVYHTVRFHSSRVYLPVEH